MRHNPNGQRGFTMIELMITTVLIGIITAMAAPQFQKVFERIKLRAAMRDMTSTLRLARSTAIATKEQYGVYFNPTNRTVTLFKDKADLTAFNFTGADSAIKVDTLPKQMVWMGTDCTNNVIAFRPNGSAGYTGNGNVWTLGYTPKVVGTSTTNVLASTGRVATQVSIY
jgi:prepilin-type N-terminal cleavage/methylation domain-containing protein